MTPSTGKPPRTPAVSVTDTAQEATLVLCLTIPVRNVLDWNEALRRLAAVEAVFRPRLLRKVTEVGEVHIERIDRVWRVSCASAPSFAQAVSEAFASWHEPCPLR